MEANSPLNSMGTYTVFDRAQLPRIGDLPKGLHIDLKFQNQAIQYCLFEPRGMKYDRAVGRERELHLSNIYATTRVYLIQYKLNYLDPSLKNHVSYSKLPT